MDVEFRRFAVEEADALARFLAGETWPHHASPEVDQDTVRSQVAHGHYESADTRTFWVIAAGVAVGVVRLFDLADATPMFDLRVRAADRGKGVGLRSVRWLTDHVFTEFPSAERIEATTRQDNHAMRAVLRRCGYAKEAHYRRSWPGRNGARHDAVGYAVLRDDWATGTVTPPDLDDEPRAGNHAGR